MDKLGRDLFSEVAANYARHRPTYPDALFAFVCSLCPQPRRLAWDLATGSGQAAVKLAETFSRVVATDLSAQQIAHARPCANVSYAVTPAKMSDAELLSTVGPPGSVDLISVAQAYHWLDHAHFAHSARQVLRAGGVVAAWCYGLPRVSAEFDAVMDKWYESTFPYWEPQRSFIDESYRTIPFPFKPLKGALGPDGAPSTGPFEFASELQWTLPDFLGYLSSWSPLPTARRQGVELLDAAAKERFKAAWGGDPDAPRLVTSPIHLLVGTVETQDGA